MIQRRTGSDEIRGNEDKPISLKGMRQVLILMKPQCTASGELVLSLTAPEHPFPFNVGCAAADFKLFSALAFPYSCTGTAPQSAVRTLHSKYSKGTKRQVETAPGGNKMTRHRRRCLRLQLQIDQLWGDSSWQEVRLRNDLKPI